jgi:hypothetical protein
MSNPHHPHSAVHPLNAKEKWKTEEKLKPLQFEAPLEQNARIRLEEQRLKWEDVPKLFDMQPEHRLPPRYNGA